VPFGPAAITVPGSFDFTIPIGLGSWQLELSVTGTGADGGAIYAENYGHYHITSSLRSSGTAVTIISTNVGHTSEFGTMVTAAPPAPFTVITFHDGGSELIIRITPIVNSNWAGYARLVGCPPYA
jgi:hypothetical protein